jgi:hypothetical protein
VLEIYPRALTGAVRKSDPAARKSYLQDWAIPHSLRLRAEESEDAFDAAISALVMSRNLDALLALQPSTDPVTRLEGWIWTPSPPGLAAPLPSERERLPRSRTRHLEVKAILAELEDLEGRLRHLRSALEALLEPGEADL